MKQSHLTSDPSYPPQKIGFESNKNPDAASHLMGMSTRFLHLLDGSSRSMTKTLVSYLPASNPVKTASLVKPGKIKYNLNRISNSVYLYPLLPTNFIVKLWGKI